MIWKDQDGCWNLEVRMCRRWFLEAEFRLWPFRAKAETWNVPSAATLLRDQITAEAEEFLEEES